MIARDRDMPHRDDLHVRRLGERTFPSPLGLSTVPDDGIADYVPDETRVSLVIEGRAEQLREPRLVEKAGPRAQNFFDPKRTRAAIVTSGGLCPGINNVIRGSWRCLPIKLRAEGLSGRFGRAGNAADLAALLIRGDDCRGRVGCGSGGLLDGRGVAGRGRDIGKVLAVPEHTGGLALSQPCEEIVGDVGSVVAAYDAGAGEFVG